MAKPCSGCSSAKFTTALQLMLRRGIKVHRDVGTCRGCAGEKLVEAARAGQPTEGVVGAAFFTKVDSAELANSMQRRDQILKAEAKGILNLPKPPAVHLWLSYVGANGKPDPNVGQMVADCLREAGLEVDYSEKSPSMRVKM